MKEELQKTVVYRVFKDGRLLPPEERTEDITKDCIFFPENVAVSKISIGRDVPLALYGFGGNAKASVFVTIPYVLTGNQQEEAARYATETCERLLGEQLDQYKDWLDSQNIDFRKVDEVLKGKK